MTIATAEPPDMETLELTVEGPIATLTLNRPDAMNAMDPQMIWDLSVAAQWLADRAPAHGVRALVVTGAGGAFSAGGDVNTFREGLEDPQVDLPLQVRRGADLLHQAIVDLRRIPFAVIAAVNGPAAGAGFSLALACDVRIASESAVFVVAYGRIGASPDGGMTYILPRLLGPSKAVELMLNDPTLSAEAALSEGLVTEVVAHDELLGRAREKAESLAAKAPHYVRMCKQLAFQSLDNQIADHLVRESHGIADSMGTEDVRRGVQAFFAGETPKFEGT